MYLIARLSQGSTDQKRPRSLSHGNRWQMTIYGSLRDRTEFLEIYSHGTFMGVAIGRDFMYGRFWVRGGGLREILY